MYTLEYVTYPLIFLCLWIISFLLHEFSHGLECNRQTGQFGRIGVSIKYLTMWHEPQGNIQNYSLYFLAGGLYSGLCFLLFSLLIYPYVLFTLVYMLWIVGVTNIVYSVYEYKYLPVWGNNRQYTVGRYTVYLSVITVMVIVYWSMI